MKHALAALLLLTSVSCHLPDPKLDAPRTYQRNGVRVSVKGLWKNGDEIVGITGDAENVSGAALKTCTLHFDVYDFHDLLQSRAVATRETFEAGEHWQFEALFTSPYTSDFDSIHPGAIEVTK